MQRARILHTDYDATRTSPAQRTPRFYFLKKDKIMNSRIMLALTGFLAAPLAFSAPQALITKTNGTGFTLPEYTRFESCEVFMNKVVVTQRFGYPDQLGFTKREVRPITLDASIRKVIEAAQSEDVTKDDNFLCDAPSTTVQFSGNPEPLTLFSSGGCGSPRLDREGPASQMLKELVNQYCPVTYDFGRRP